MNKWDYDKFDDDDGDYPSFISDNNSSSKSEESLNDKISNELIGLDDTIEFDKPKGVSRRSMNNEYGDQTSSVGSKKYLYPEIVDNSPIRYVVTSDDEESDAVVRRIRPNELKYIEDGPNLSVRKNESNQNVSQVKQDENINENDLSNVKNVIGAPNNFSLNKYKETTKHEDEENNNISHDFNDEEEVYSSKKIVKTEQELKKSSNLDDKYFNQFENDRKVNISDDIWVNDEEKNKSIDQIDFKRIFRNFKIDDTKRNEKILKSEDNNILEVWTDNSKQKVDNVKTNVSSSNKSELNDLDDKNFEDELFKIDYLYNKQNPNEKVSSNLSNQNSNFEKNNKMNRNSMDLLNNDFKSIDFNALERIIDKIKK